MVTVTEAKPLGRMTKAEMYQKGSERPKAHAARWRQRRGPDGQPGRSTGDARQGGTTDQASPNAAGAGPHRLVARSAGASPHRLVARPAGEKRQRNGESAGPTKPTVLGIELDFVDYASALETINKWRGMDWRRYVVFTNPHSVMLARRDGEMRRATLCAGLVLPDGAGMVLAARLLGYEHNGRVTGPTFMLRLCDWGRRHGYRHFFYGGGEGVAEALSVRLCDEYPGLQIAGALSPPFRPLAPEEDAAVVEKINSAAPDIVWVGLGAPKQEKWMHAHVGRVKAAAMIGVGAAFDFHAGRVRWAPAVLRNLGLEWAWRLIQEPGRMWRRNLDSPLFVCRVVSQRLQKRGGGRGRAWEPEALHVRSGQLEATAEARLGAGAGCRPVVLEWESKQR